MKDLNKVMKQDNLLNTNQKGLTLIELLISMAVMALIIGGLVTAFISHSRISAEEEARMEVQQNLRVAVDRVKDTLRHAGFGSYDKFEENEYMSIDEPQGDTIEIRSFVDHINNNYSEDQDLNSDSIIIVYASHEIDIEEIDEVAYYTFHPNIEGNMFYESDFENNIDEDLTILEVSPIRIHLTADSILYFKDFAYNNPIHWEVAENIVDIQFQFFADGAWHDSEDTITDLQNIRKIRFWILGKSEEQVSNAGNHEFEVRVDKDDVYDESDMCEETDGNDCITYQVGPFNDGHVRMLSRGEVVLRNAF